MRIADLEKYTAEELYKNYTAFAEHFEDGQFMNPSEKKSLIHMSIPTIFNMPNPPPKVTPRRQLPKQHLATSTISATLPIEYSQSSKDIPKKI